MLKNRSSMTLNLFKYYNKLPLFDGCKYRLEGKILKFRSLDRLLSFYRFKKDRVYIIQIFNDNVTDLDKHSFKGMRAIDAYPVLAEHAEFREISIFNNQICDDLFNSCGIEVEIDFDYIYGDKDFFIGDVVRSSISDQSYKIDFYENYRYDTADKYNKYYMMSLKLIEEVEDVDLRPLLKMKNYLDERRVPICTIYKVDEEFHYIDEEN